MKLETFKSRIVGMDPGMKAGVPSVTVFDFPKMVSYEAMPIKDAIKYAKGAESVIIERPDPTQGIRGNYAVLYLMHMENIAGRLQEGICQNDTFAIQVSAKQIREWTCGWNPWLRVKADSYIKNWIKNTHLPNELELTPAQVKELFKQKSALSTDHKRDAYLAAWLGVMMTTSPLLKSRVLAVAQ